MEILKLREAIQLYLLIKPYLPNILKDITPIDFIRQLVDNIIRADKSKVYLEMVVIMSRIPIDALIRKSPDEVLNICIEGLIKNHILEMIDFCEKVGL